jgi:GDPmannose 4,6-dehydratase
VTAVARELGINIRWTGSGSEEEGLDARTGARIVAIDPKYFRPAEVDGLVGDAGKARAKLGWKPRTSFAEMIAEMVQEEMALSQAEERQRGTPALGQHA